MSLLRKLVISLKGKNKGYVLLPFMGIFAKIIKLFCSYILDIHHGKIFDIISFISEYGFIIGILFLVLLYAGENSNGNTFIHNKVD